MKQKRSKSIDMRFHWLKDRVEQKQIAVNWAPGIENLGDYPTKHHFGSHHRKVRPIYLYLKDKSPSTMQECARILKDDGSPRAQLKARSPVQPLNIHGKSTSPNTESSLNKAKHMVSTIWQKHKHTLNSPFSYSLK